MAWITAVVRVWTQVLKRQCPGIFTLPYSIFTLPRHCMQYVSEILECSIAGLVYLVYLVLFRILACAPTQWPASHMNVMGGFFFYLYTHAEAGGTYEH